MQGNKDAQLDTLKKRYEAGEISLDEFIEARDRLLGVGAAAAEEDHTEFQFAETQEIGHFRLLEGLDDGGMGQVWKALNLECQKHFSEDCHRALKFPRPQDANNEQIRRILKREAEASKRLAKCPHVITVYGWHEVPHSDGAGSHVFVEMEYLQGHSFRHWLDNDWQEGLPFERVLELIEPAAQALDCAHQKKLLHRDLKPANLFLTDEGEVKVLDFGIADEIRRTTSDSSYQPSEVAPYRTASYMAPEANTQKPEPRQDVHALACVIYELLTGRPPFYTTPDIPRHPNLLPEKPEALNEAAWQLLCQGFAFKPEPRPASAGELVMALRQAQVGSPQGAQRNAGKGDTPESPDSAAGANRAMAKEPNGGTLHAWGKAVAALVVVMGLGGAWQQGWLGGEAPVSSNTATTGSPQEAQHNAGKKEAPNALDSAAGSIRTTKPALPPVQTIHGWSDGGNWSRVQELQQATAKALEMPVVFRDQLKDGSKGPEMVLIPAGSYLMGGPEEEPERDDAEGPQHEVTIARPYALGKYPVTTEEYLRCVEAGGCRPPEWLEEGNEYNIHTGSKGDYKGFTEDRQPIVGVSWKDAVAYAQWLSEQTGQEYRLPSEAEWEYAARGGTSTPFYTGDCISTDQANYNGSRADYNHCGAKTGDYLGKTTPVGRYPANPFGLYDMAGNVWERLQDCWNWNGSYEGAPTDGSAWESGVCAWRVLRGGSWYNEPGNLRSAIRGRVTTGLRFLNWGFRLARTVTP